MNKIDKMLEGVDVEWKKLGEFCKVLRGKRLTKKELVENGKYPVFHGGLIPLGLYDKYNRKANQTMVINTGSIGEVVWSSINFWSSDGTFVIETNEEIEDKFLYYYLKTQESFLKNQKREGGVPTIDRAVVENLKIPIPPLEVQQEIVSILDKFIELTAELTAELEARKKQYEYYREKLLSFNDVVGGGGKWLTMSELGVFARGGALQKSDFTKSGVGCIHYGQIYTYYGTYTHETLTYVSDEFAKKARKAKPGDLVIATTSENDEDLCKAVAWLGNEEIAVSSDACFYSHNMNPKYVAYFFQTNHFHKQKRRFITGAKVRRVNANDLAKVKIPVPSLEEQARIVAILDKFDILTHSISEGLPKEIELRQKQYAYYRDQLLTFDGE